MWREGILQPSCYNGLGILQEYPDGCGRHQLQGKEFSQKITQEERKRGGKEAPGSQKTWSSLPEFSASLSSVQREGKDSPGKWNLIQTPSPKHWKSRINVHYDEKNLFRRLQVGIGDLGVTLGNINEPDPARAELRTSGFTQAANRGSQGNTFKMNNVHLGLENPELNAPTGHFQHKSGRFSLTISLFLPATVTTANPKAQGRLGHSHLATFWEFL